MRFNKTKKIFFKNKLKRMKKPLVLSHVVKLETRFASFELKKVFGSYKSVTVSKNWLLEM